MLLCLQMLGLANTQVHFFISHRKSFELNQASPCLLEAVNRHVAPPNTEEESPIKTVVGATGSEGITISILLNIMYIVIRYSCLTGPSLYVAGKKMCIYVVLAFIKMRSQKTNPIRPNWAWWSGWSFLSALPSSLLLLFLSLVRDQGNLAKGSKHSRLPVMKSIRLFEEQRLRRLLHHRLLLRRVVRL